MKQKLPSCILFLLVLFSPYYGVSMETTETTEATEATETTEATEATETTDDKILLAELLHCIVTQSFVPNAEGNSSCFGWVKPKRQKDCSINTEQLMGYCSELKGFSETGVRCTLQITEDGRVKIALPKEEERKEALRIMSKYPKVFSYAFNCCSNEQSLEFYKFYTQNEGEIKKAGGEFLGREDLIDSCKGNSIDEVIKKMENEILQKFFNSIYSSNGDVEKLTFAATNPMVKALIASLLSRKVDVFESKVDFLYKQFLLSVWHATIPSKFLTEFLMEYYINERVK